jgi:sulfur-carrier protein
MHIQLRFFAGIRETLGLAQESIDLPGHVNTAGAVRQFLIARGGSWAAALGEQRLVRMAYNQHMADTQTPVADGGELAFFPPVTGG